MEERELEQLPDNGFTELWLHYIWRESKLDDIRLLTEDNRELSIVFTGWYNRSWGPDFSAARITIDGVEYFGDIEIHVAESSWCQHRHDQDNAYNKVVLHVFFRKDGRTAKNRFGQSIPALHLGNPLFRSLWYRHDINRPVIMKELPGACGLCLTEEKHGKLKNLIFQAAEQRLLGKAALLQAEIQSRDAADREDLLFRKICQAAGYTEYTKPFDELVQNYPYSLTTFLLRSMHRQNRIEILGRWLGFMGFLDGVVADQLHHSLRREWLSFQQFWESIPDAPTVSVSGATNPSRPYNHPLRRLVGLYYHLEKVHFQGLLKSWLKFLMDCRPAIAARKHQSKMVLEMLDEMFPQPDWEPLNWLLSASSQKKTDKRIRLIGKQRQLIILVNAIIPFFLSWARECGDRDLESTLFNLFLVLPAEAKNRKTRFLEQRLLPLNPKFKMKKNLSYHQGLIQLHDDCCKSYYEGCRNCSLVKLIQKTDLE